MHSIMDSGSLILAIMDEIYHFITSPCGVKKPCTSSDQSSSVEWKRIDFSGGCMYLTAEQGTKQQQKE